MALLSAPARAQSAPPEVPAFTLRGFGTLGLARSSNGEAEFLRDISQPTGVSNKWSARNDTLLGLQANYRINQAAEVTVQGVSHYRHDGSFTPDLTGAFLKYTINPRLTLRAGRIGTEFLMQSDSRMVGYAYLPVRPSAEFFGGVPINYGDGIDAEIRWPIGDGVLSSELFAGYAAEKLPLYELSNSLGIKWSLGYQQGSWLFRYIYAQLRTAKDIADLNDLRSMLSAVGAESAAHALGLAGTMARYHSLGATYDNGNWQIQTAINLVNNEFVMFENSRSAYIIVGHRFGPISPFAGYARGLSGAKTLDTGLPDAFFSELNTGVANVLKQTHQDRRTISLGARWDFARNMDLKAQIDWIKGDVSSVFLYENIKPGWNGQTTLFSVALDFVF
ncbi:MAG: hypothetical protein CVU16_07835 [Betaproteobacteria bacterium HGW-Betaproteobacteria-10]|nr:MAG: hypothetical protein CVU16_07835 [Betaproteobacteria bacterium HGW-Betaproteobacteria-10]